MTSMSAITKAEWEPLQKEWFGDKYAAMQPVDAVRQRCSDLVDKIIELEAVAVPLPLFVDRPSKWSFISARTIVELLDRYDDGFDEKLQALLERAEGLGALEVNADGLVSLLPEKI